MSILFVIYFIGVFFGYLAMLIFLWEEKIGKGLVCLFVGGIPIVGFLLIAWQIKYYKCMCKNKKNASKTS